MKRVQPHILFISVTHLRNVQPKKIMYLLDTRLIDQNRLVLRIQLLNSVQSISTFQKTN